MSRAGRCGSWPSESWSGDGLPVQPAVADTPVGAAGPDKRAAVAQELLALVPQEFANHPVVVRRAGHGAHVVVGVVTLLNGVTTEPQDVPRRTLWLVAVGELVQEMGCPCSPLADTRLSEPRGPTSAPPWHRSCWHSCRRNSRQPPSSCTSCRPRRSRR